MIQLIIRYRGSIKQVWLLLQCIFKGIEGMNQRLQKVEKFTEEMRNLKSTETNLTKGNKWLFFLQDIYIKNVV